METGINVKIGKLSSGEDFTIDITQAPHMLVAGATGSGKSVFLHSLICNLIQSYSPENLKIILVDPKKVEFPVYEGIPHLFEDIATTPDVAFCCLESCINEMERRMILFSEKKVWNIGMYNEKQSADVLPYIVMIIDEYSELMTVDKVKTEKYLKRITSIARFTGIHVVLATQRPSVDVISGVIKSNLPTLIAFSVANEATSKIIIDQRGAEKLNEVGAFLYKSITCRVPLKCLADDIRMYIPSILENVKVKGLRQ